MIKSSGDLRISQARGQRRNVALALNITATGHGCANAVEQHCMTTTSCSLSISLALDQRWNVALAPMMLAAGHNCAIAPEQNRMTISS
jgi:hypothetical protein